MDRTESLHSAPPVRPWHLIRRGVWIGLPLVALCSIYVAYGEIRLGAELVNSSLMIPPVCILLLLCLGNAAWARRRPGRALDRRELLTVYILLIVSVCINGKGMMEMLLPTIAEIRYFAVPRRWSALLKASPRWWLPTSGAVQGFFTGQEPLRWKGWLVPFAVWGAFLCVLLFTTFCICLLIRRQWIKRERLVFPMTVLPLEMTRTEGSVLRSRVTWFAFTLIFAIESLNSLHQWFPLLPHIPIKSSDLDISGVFTSPPWNALKGWSISFYPFAIGIAFLLTTEVSFSCWFFYVLVARMEVVASVGLGLHVPGAASSLSRFPYIGEQGAGAYFGFALLVLWIARQPMLRALRTAASRLRPRAAGGYADADSPVEPPEDAQRGSALERKAAVGLLLGLAVLVAFCLIGGSRMTVALLFWAITLAMILTMTRARAEGGTVWALGPDTAASIEVVRITGTAGIPAPSIALLAVMQFFTNDWRALVMPNQLEALRMADAAEIPVRKLLGPLAIATVMGIVVSFWASLAVWYHYGCATGQVDNWALFWGGVPWDFGKHWLDNSKPPDVPGLYGVAVGALTVFILAALRTRFLWWPLHPIGYVLGSSGDLADVWFCFFLGWLIKTLALRYGGRRLFSRMLPFFLGMILGDYAAAGFWSLIGMIANVPVYKVFP